MSPVFPRTPDSPAGVRPDSPVRRLGFDLFVFNRAQANLATRIGNTQALVIFTGNISHQARNTALDAARARTIPVFQYHTCGVCTLRRCLADLPRGARPRPDAVA